jgi:DNA-directed RNA polymerase specialized sigma24 family protein
VEGFSYEEAARALEVPLGTIRSRLYRARRQLYAQLSGGESARQCGSS